jgi:hypothetical protein
MVPVPVTFKRFTGYPTIKSGIRPDTGSLKIPDYPAGYPANRIIGANLIRKY